ncbi:MAG TPA: Maf family nucleotide pyrophosphatase [Usitatibacteraceae bacterium]|nr:Maf family nucleotide pyrophosphatase [Usitatibacteraceae bacterium]
MKTNLILASSSPYRAELLRRLRLPFSVVRPSTDEAARPGELPEALARRLSIAKAQDVARNAAGCVVIGSDQVAELAGEAINKPGSLALARAQLRRLSGQTLVFHSGLAVLDTRSGRCEDAVVPTTVRFRRLSDAAIERYLELEPAFDCAGSAKAEGLGIALLESVRSEDPTALIGLPLITLTTMLQQCQIELPA